MSVTLPELDTEIKVIPPYKVILHNDDFHSFEFVIQLIQRVFGYKRPKCYELTWIIHTHGLCVVWTGPKEVAELKVEQVSGISEIRPDGKNLGPLYVTMESP